MKSPWKTHKWYILPSLYTANGSLSQKGRIGWNVATLPCCLDSYWSSNSPSYTPFLSNSFKGQIAINKWHVQSWFSWWDCTCSCYTCLFFRYVNKYLENCSNIYFRATVKSHFLALYLRMSAGRTTSKTWLRMDMLWGGYHNCLRIYTRKLLFPL